MYEIVQNVNKSVYYFFEQGNLQNADVQSENKLNILKYRKQANDTSLRVKLKSYAQGMVWNGKWNGTKISV